MNYRFLFVMVGLLMLGHAASAQRFVVEDVTPPLTGVDRAFAHAVSKDGVYILVSGENSSTGFEYLLTNGQFYQLMEGGSTIAVNSSGTIVGFDEAEWEPIYWSGLNGPYSYLDASFDAECLNDSDVAGGSNDLIPALYSLFTDTLTTLPLLSGYGIGDVFGLNSLGDACGHCTLVYDVKPTYWHNNSGTYTVQALASPGQGHTGAARALNDQEQIVGSTTINGSAYYGWLWSSPTSSPTALITTSGHLITPNSIDEDGTIFGDGEWKGLMSIPLVWSDGVISRLPMLPGCFATSLYEGYYDTAVGVCVKWDGGLQWRAAKWTRCYGPAWDVNCDGFTDDLDLGIVLAHQGECDDEYAFDPNADVNGDGCVDDLDLAIVLAH